jgi:plastocyanin
MPPSNSQPSAAPPTGRRWPLHLHKRGVWLVIILVALALIVIYLVGHRNQLNQSARQLSKYSAQVTITSSGFNPATLSVKPNTQVTWSNQDTSLHEVAADPYPKNDSIAGFVSTDVLQIGDTYSFSFTHSGTYHYHDQLNPYKLLGTVVVQ